MLYALGFFFMFAIGGLTGLPLAILPTNFNVHDTYFVVAHFHYVMFGGALFLFIGGLHYWWPKITGRMYNEPLGRICCLLEFWPSTSRSSRSSSSACTACRGGPPFTSFIPSSSTCTSCRRYRRVPAACGLPGHGRPICCIRFSAARGPRPTPGAARRWNGAARRHRRTIISRNRPASAGLTTTAAWNGTRRRKVMSGRKRSLSRTQFKM